MIELLIHSVKNYDPLKTLIIVPNNTVRSAFVSEYEGILLPRIETLYSFLKSFSKYYQEPPELFLIVKLKEIISQYESVRKRTADTLYTAELFLDEIKETLRNLDLQGVYKLKNLLALYEYYKEDKQNISFLKRLEVIYSEFIEILNSFIQILENNNIFLYEYVVNVSNNSEFFENVLENFDNIVISYFYLVYPIEIKFIQSFISNAIQQGKNIHILLPFESGENPLIKKIYNKIYDKFSGYPRVNFHYASDNVVIKNVKKIYISSYTAQSKLIAKLSENTKKRKLIILLNKELLFTLMSSLAHFHKNIDIFVSVPYIFFSIIKAINIIIKAIVYKYNIERTVRELEYELFPIMFNKEFSDVEKEMNFIVELKEFIVRYQCDNFTGEEIIFNLYSIFESALEKNLFTKLEEKFIRHFQSDIIEYLSVNMEDLRPTDKLLYFLHWINQKTVNLTNKDRGVSITTIDSLSLEKYEDIYLFPSDKDLLPRSYIRKHIILPQIKSALNFASYNDVVKKQLYYLISTFVSADNLYVISSGKQEESNYSFALSAFLSESVEEESYKLPVIRYNYEFIFDKTDFLVFKLEEILKQGISFSIIREFIQNPFNFILSKIYGVDLQNLSDPFVEVNKNEIVDKIELGSIIHKILNRFYRNYKENTESYDKITNILREIANEELQSIRNYNEELFPAYKDFILNTIVKKMKTNIIELDLKYKIHSVNTELELEVPLGEEWYFKGFIDKFMITEDGILIISDYKYQMNSVYFPKNAKKISSLLNVIQDVLIEQKPSIKGNKWNTLQLISYLFLVCNNYDLDKLGIENVILRIDGVLTYETSQNFIHLSVEESEYLSEMFRRHLLEFISNNFISRESKVYLK